MCAPTPPSPPLLPLGGVPPSMAGPNAAALLKAEVIPDDVEEVTKAKRKEERTRAHKTTGRRYAPPPPGI